VSEHVARQRTIKNVLSRVRLAQPTVAPQGVAFVLAELQNGAALESVHFDPALWMPSDAQRWLREHGFVTAHFQEANSTATHVASAKV
jgi:hypothetical protein